MSFSIAEPAERAASVTTILWNDTPGARYGLKDFVTYARERCGVVLGTGIGSLGGRAFRIAHMGHTNAPMLLGTLSVVEMSLKALGISHGSGGVEAAIRFLASNVKP